MNERQKELTSQAPKKKLLRPALIASERIVSEYSVFLEHLLVGFADESIPVALVCPPPCDAGSVFTGAAEVISHPVCGLPLTEHLNRRLLVEQLAKFEPTVLHCLCESKISLTRHLARQLGLPCVLTVNSFHKRWKHFVCQRRMYRLSGSAGHCGKIIVPAKSVATNIAEVYPRLAQRIEQINIGTFVEENTVCFSQSSRLASLVVAHPLDNVGDFENLFSAVRHLAVDGYEFMMVVMGSGRAERQLRKLLTAFDLLQTVTIVPRLKPWRSVFTAGDIFIQPQPSAAFNPFLLEAMSVGAAVAACKGGVDDLIIEDQTAVVFDPNDELSIVGALQRLFDRREFARQIAKKAQEYLMENHTVSKMISATLQTYHEASRLQTT
jgi:glycosyltransferase involved in cell wall biosynthesis